MNPSKHRDFSVRANMLGRLVALGAQVMGLVHGHGRRVERKTRLDTSLERK